jgi:hypothetical protein
MTISVLFLIGRFLFAVPFVMLGMDRLLAADARGIERWWGLVGIVGAAGVVLGVWGDIAALVIGVSVVGGGIVECRVDATDATRVRLVALFGAALVTAAVYIAVGSALNLVLTDPVLDLDLR